MWYLKLRVVILIEFVMLLSKSFTLSGNLDFQMKLAGVYNSGAYFLSAWRRISRKNNKRKGKFGQPVQLFVATVSRS